jgi:hypothetical protein
VDDPVAHLKDARVFAFGPSRDRCYRRGSMENVAEFYRTFSRDPAQVKLVTDQPFPHTLPRNSTPYFNSSTPAGYDGPGECLRHVFGKPSKPLAPAVPTIPTKDNWLIFDQSEFVEDKGVGVNSYGLAYIPPQCQGGTDFVCKLLVLMSGCPPLAIMETVESSFEKAVDGEMNDFARYGLVNDIVVLKYCLGFNLDRKRFPHSHENIRGLSDVYGQLSPDYATQIGPQLKPIGKILRRVLGYELTETVLV